MNKKTPKMGRPPVPMKLKKTFQVSVSMTEAERIKLERVAKEAGLSVSELLMHPWRDESKES